MFRDSGIDGKFALVTGGSRGIGREIVRLLAAEGADVTFFYRADEEAARSVESGCRDEGGKVTALQVDVRDARACEEEKAINAERSSRIRVVETGDHAVTWRLFWALKTPYAILPARFSILEAALAVSRERGIGLATPLTHVVSTRAEEPRSS